MTKREKSRTLHIIISVDVENDVYYYQNKKTPEVRDIDGWLGLRKGIPKLLKIFEKVADSSGRNPKITWFIRVDFQLEKLYGDAGHILISYKNLWKKLSLKGHEIAFHPHLYRRVGKYWTLETRPEYLTRQLRESFHRMIDLGFIPQSSRIGEAFMSNEVMKCLAELGLKIDSTAIPHRFRRDKLKMIDWRGTPQTPYYPAPTNYRIFDEKRSIGILEVPMTTVRTRVSYDSKPRWRYVNLSYYNHVLATGLREHIRKYDVLVTVVHPFEVLPEMGKTWHPLISFDEKEVEKNLRFIISECKNVGKKSKFIRLKDVKKCILRDIK